MLAVFTTALAATALAATALAATDLPATDLPANTAPAADLVAATATAAARLTAEPIASGYAVVAAPPFVVVGDASIDEVARRAEQVTRTVAALGATLFDRQAPTSPIELWLFHDTQSYVAGVRALIGGPPPAVYGFHLPVAHLVAVNLATGDGTMVHEIVHPLALADFGRTPPIWLDEGLGSLYESTTAGAQLRSVDNDRLQVLLAARRAGRMPALAELLTMDRATFFGPGLAVHYAAARYLARYLEDRGELAAVYRRMRDRDDDPSGTASLVEVLGAPSLEAIADDWERFVVGLDGAQRRQPPPTWRRPGNEIGGFRP